MAKGGSGIGSRGGRGKVITDYDGSTIDMSHAPLEYGKSDKAMSNQVRDAIDKFEERRAQAKVEYAYMVDQDGNEIVEKRGGKGSVRTLITDWMKASTFSHIHPREAGVLGGTFSDQDFDSFLKHPNVGTMRAAAKEGVYSMSRGKGFNGNAFKNWVKQKGGALKSEFTKAAKSLESQYRSGQITYDVYAQRYNREFNKYLSDRHKMLLSGQKQFGYHYTLERRSKK